MPFFAPKPFLVTPRESGEKPSTHRSFENATTALAVARAHGEIRNIDGVLLATFTPGHGVSLKANFDHQTGVLAAQ